MSIHVMVIDDSQTVQGFMARYLGRTEPRVEISSAPNGQAGLDRIAADPAHPPDLIFLDWEMPILDGPATFDQLRAKGYRMPVIMLTSRNEVRDIERMITAGVDEYVMKPFTAEMVLEKMSAVLGRPVVADAG